MHDERTLRATIRSAHGRDAMSNRGATPTPRSGLRDDIAYVLPMAIFLIFNQVGSSWPGLYTTSYIVKTFLTAAALVVCWQYYTPIRWHYWWLGIIFGVLGIVQWVGMEHLLHHFWPNFWEPKVDPFNPFQSIASPSARWSFIGIRWAGAALVVPFMEELFWRDFLWRTIAAPNDFKLAEVGEPNWMALFIVSALFCSVHVQWLTAFVWGLMIGLLLLFTRSLGACIIMHGVTNFLLGCWVLRTGEWSLW
jgi:uncharacterized protein